MGESKIVRKWKIVDDSELEDTEMVDEAPSKQKRGKFNTTIKYNSENPSGRCKHLNLECLAR